MTKTIFFDLTDISDIKLDETGSAAHGSDAGERTGSIHSSNDDITPLLRDIDNARFDTIQSGIVGACKMIFGHGMGDQQLVNSGAQDLATAAGELKLLFFKNGDPGARFVVEEDELRQVMRSLRKIVKERYGACFNAVDEIVARHDVMDLLCLCAPRDEYELEVVDVVRRLDTVEDREDMRALVRAVFERAFSEDQRKHLRYDVMADEIWAAWVRWKGHRPVNLVNVGHAAALPNEVIEPRTIQVGCNDPKSEGGF
jgi:hypothetical protein